MIRTLLLTTAALVFGATAVAAETHEVEMWTRGPDGGRYVYTPAFLQIEPGDTVKFIASEPGHNAASVEGAIPEGAEPFDGAINEEIEVTLTEEGVYVYKCTPHYTLGMVGVILVGEAAPNLDQVADQRYLGRSNRIIADLLDEVRTTVQ